MAPKPQLDDFGALAIKPPRVNIFARPAATSKTRSGGAAVSGGAFDASAACRPEPIADAPQEESGASQVWTWMRAAGIVALVSIGVATAVIATASRHQPSTVSAPPAGQPRVVRSKARPAMPPDGPSRRRASRRSAPTVAPAARTPHVKHATPRPRSEQRAAPTPRSIPPASTPPVPVTPPVRTPPTFVPNRTTPARVPKGAPPEFM